MVCGVGRFAVGGPVTRMGGCGHCGNFESTPVVTDDVGAD